MASWATLKETSIFADIFPDRQVPIRSIVPIVPREAGAPLCYMVLGDRLSDEQVARLAERLYEQWRPECTSIEQAREYIREGLPLRTDHFSGIGTDEYYQMKWGAALSMAMRMQDQDGDSGLPRI